MASINYGEGDLGISGFDAYCMADCHCPISHFDARPAFQYDRVETLTVPSAQPTELWAFWKPLPPSEKRKRP